MVLSKSNWQLKSVDKNVVKQSLLHAASWSAREYVSICTNNHKTILPSHLVFVCSLNISVFIENWKSSDYFLMKIIKVTFCIALCQNSM